MMRGLAQFIMRGRVQAVMAVALGIGSVIFAWVSAAAIGLVTLRKGINEGGYLLFWALIPAIAVTVWGSDVGPLTAVLGTAMAAGVLRYTISWSLTLLSIAAYGLLVALLLQTVGAEYIEMLLQLVENLFSQLREQMEAGQADRVATPVAAHLSGLLGLSAAITCTLSLILARWWQSALYNPGGFGEEFRKLRMSPRETALLLVMGFLLTSLGPEYRMWSLIMAVPLVFAGFGLVHGIAAHRKLAGQWLVLFYICWLLLEPLRMALVLFAIADSWVNFRQRLVKNQS